MENNKNNTRKRIAPSFGRDKQRALKVLKDEKKARDAYRKKHNEKVA